jgi:ABC-type multidrug transport system ATPase subunit
VDIVEATLTDLSIKECGDVVVGGVDKPGISGGQRRRVSIGLELIVNPSVLFLDVRCDKSHILMS